MTADGPIALALELAVLLDAVHRRSSFNLIHLDTMQKVDLFVLGDGLLDRRQLSRRQRVQVGEGPSRALWVGSPEDQVLRKLAWYRLVPSRRDAAPPTLAGALQVQGRAERVDQ